MLYPPVRNIPKEPMARPDQGHDGQHEQRSDRSQAAPTCVRCLLQMQYGTQLTAAEQTALATAITPYLNRTRLPLARAVRTIATNYLRDGARVERLMHSPTSPEWELVLQHVISYATRQSHFPSDAEARNWPDLDAYSDIQQRITSYNFEGTFDHWVTATVANRLRRFWRDQQAIRVGGPGIRQRRPCDGELSGASSPRPPAYVVAIPLDGLTEQSIPADEESVAERIEAGELRRLVAHSLATFAAQKQDTQLPLLWFALVEQRLKLREIAACFGLTISQVHRRIEYMRAHLQRDLRVQMWLQASD